MKELAEKKTADIVQMPQTQEAAVMNMLQTALEKGVDADSLEKLLNMQERILDRQAEQAYTVAMVEVQSAMPKILKNKHNDQTNSDYANLEQIIKTITPIYTGKGFSLSFGTADSPLANHVRVTCDVLHSGGHSKHYFIDTPLDMTGIKGSVNKTATHGDASAKTYGRRILTGMIFNLNTGYDDDGNAAGYKEIELINEDQVANMDALIEEVGADKANFLKFCKVDKLENMPASKFKEAINALESKRK